jgi:hypothetical protein
MTKTNTELEEALAKNNEIWQKRLLLLALIMVIALLGL